MEKLSSILPFCFLIILEGCCSSERSKEIQIGIQNKAISQLPKRNNVTAIKQNVTVVDAIVDSIVIIDSLRYRMSLIISSATAIEDIESFAEAGQHIMLTPAYIVNDVGNIDLRNDRNQRLFNLHSVQSGVKIRGKVSLGVGGAWVLIDVFEN